MKLGILNAPVLTSNGNFSIKKISLEQARELINNNIDNLDSAVGHQSTAEVMTTLLGVQIDVNRQQFEQQVGQQALVFQLKRRAPEGVILTADEIEQIGYTFKLLTMTEIDESVRVEKRNNENLKELSLVLEFLRFLQEKLNEENETDFIELRLRDKKLIFNKFNEILGKNVSEYSDEIDCDLECRKNNYEVSAEYEEYLFDQKINISFKGYAREPFLEISDIPEYIDIFTEKLIENDGKIKYTDFITDLNEIIFKLTGLL